MIYIKEIKPTYKLPGGSSLLVTFSYNQGIVDTIKQVPNAIWHKKISAWEIPVTSLARAIELLSNYDTIDLTLLEDKEEALIKQYPIGPFKTEPYSYQKEGINYGLNVDNFLLLDAPGLGKSLQIIYLAQELKKRDNIEHCLIICGVNTLKHNWKREIERHSDLTCRILGERVSSKGNVKIGSVKDRVDDLLNPIDDFFLITNVESLRSEEFVNALNKNLNKIDMIALDEAHCCKSPSAAQSKGLMKLNAPHKIAMTGTVLTNSPLDAYLPLKWIGEENSTFTNFKYYYCSYSGPFNNILVGYKNLNVLKYQLEKCSLRRTKDLLDLPPKNIINEVVTMDDAQSNFYQNIVDGVVEQVDKVEINTSTLLSMVTRLRQATACPSILTTENIRSAKIDRAVDLTKQIVNNGDKVVVFSTFKETLNKFIQELDDCSALLCTGDVSDVVISENIEKFQTDSNYKVLCATTAKMGTGVTLTSASYAIFIDVPWTAANFEQAQDRIHRIGSGKPVFIYHLITENTIDERVKEIVEDKEAMSDFVVDDKLTPKSIDSLKKYILDL